MIKQFPIIILILVLSTLMVSNVSASTGFGPAEIYTSNQRDTLIIGNVTIINGDDVAKYGVFSIVMPYSNKDTYQIVESEIIHARVICNVCGNSMQRWEAIPGYQYGDPLVGTCTECGSNDLTFYTSMPRDEYEMFSLESAGNFHLEKVDHHTWKTKELISPKGACSIHICYDASESYIQENLYEHWEIHLRGKTVEEAGEGFMAGGIDLRVLVTFKFPLHITIIDEPEKGGRFRVKITYGPPDRSWEVTPNEPVTVDFNGEEQTTNEEGIVEFTFPDTRYDYDYDITAEGSDTHLSSTETITSNNGSNGEEENNNDIFGFLNNIYVIITILALVVIICVGLIIYRYYWE